MQSCLTIILHFTHTHTQHTTFNTTKATTTRTTNFYTIGTPKMILKIFCISNVMLFKNVVKFHIKYTFKSDLIIF